MTTVLTSITVGAIVKYHGSIEEHHGLYTVEALIPAQGPAHMLTGANATRLVLSQGDFLLSNVRSQSVSMPLIGDFEPHFRVGIDVGPQHAIRVSS